MMHQYTCVDRSRKQILLIDLFYVDFVLDHVPNDFVQDLDFKVKYFEIGNAKVYNEVHNFTRLNIRLVEISESDREWTHIWE